MKSYQVQHPNIYANIHAHTATHPRHTHPLARRRGAGMVHELRIGRLFAAVKSFVKVKKTNTHVMLVLRKKVWCERVCVYVCVVIE